MEDYHYLWFRVSSSDLYIVHMYQMLNWKHTGYDFEGK